MNIVSVRDWGIFPDSSPCIIAGPCSAESQTQIMETARQLKKAGVSVLRAGLWKPRTYPGSFEGVGSAGILWMKEAREELGIKICTEVAGTRHIEECLNADFDLLWIGARTTVNPFLMQEIADALAGTDIPVLVKNPVNLDIDLWIGAVERLYLAGVRKIGVIHRGFTPERKGRYRNDPIWDCPIEIKSRYPELPVFCDPSHIAGKTELVPEIAQQALNLGAEGLIVESHICPEKALSDASQQIPSAEFGKFLSSLSKKDEDSTLPLYRSTIADLRSKIDSVDADLLRCLAERMELSRQIGQCKKDNNISIIQSSRWNELMTGILKNGREMGLDEQLLTSIYNAIHKASVKVQD